MLTKQKRYYFDQEAIKEECVSNNDEKHTLVLRRNIRSVWTITSKPYKGAHFAVFPPALIEPCIKAGPVETCQTCGKPRTRITEKRSISRHKLPPDHPAYRPERYEDGKAGSPQSPGAGQRFQEVTDIGWTDCGHNNYAPSVVLDPFLGSGTTAIVAHGLGRRTVGIELNPEYAVLAVQRYIAAQEQDA